MDDIPAQLFYNRFEVVKVNAWCETAKNNLTSFAKVFGSNLEFKNKRMITWNDFEKIDIRTGTIIEVNDFPKARKPSYQLTIDFGELGIKKSSAQITHHYKKDDLLDKQIIAVVNFPPKQIATFFSECLVLGVYDENNNVVLLQPDKKVGNGFKIG